MQNKSYAKCSAVCEKFFPTSRLSTFKFNLALVFTNFSYFASINNSEGDLQLLN